MQPTIPARTRPVAVRTLVGLRASRRVRTLARRVLSAVLLASAMAAPLAPIDMVPGLASVGLVARASAQSQRDIVCNAMGMRRFDRLSRAYLAPTDAELEALDRLHEAYLDKFRAELEPQIEALIKTMSGSMPTKSEFERFLRELDALNARIAEADTAFLNAVADVVAEPRKAAVNRLREARERQRLLAGLGRFAPMMFGGGGSFVDLSDLVVQPRVLASVPAERREQFDAVLAGMEQRLTAQARAYNARMREGMLKFFEAASAMQGGLAPVEGEAPEQTAARVQAMQQAYVDAMSEVGGEFRRAVRGNFDANRDALQQLSQILPEDVALDLRTRAALKAIGLMSVGMSMGAGGDPETVVRRLSTRIGRAGSVTPEARAQAEAVLVAWRRTNAESLEAIARAVSEGASASPFDAGGSPESRAIGEAVAAREQREQDVYRQLLAILGAGNGIIEERMMPDESGEPTVAQLFIADESETDATGSASAGPGGDIPEATLPGLDMSGAQPFEPRFVAEAFRMLGTEPGEGDVVDAIVDSWRTNEWIPRIEPLRRELAAASARVYSAGADGQILYDDEAVRTVERVRQQMSAAVFELDAKLATSLSGALGLAIDDPSLLLLRLERLAVLAGRGAGADSGYPRSILQLLKSAELDPATARAVLENGRAGWTALADEIPALAAAVLERGRQITVAERGFSTRDPQLVRESSADYTRLLQEGTAANAALGKRIGEIYDSACAAAITDPDTSHAARIARLRAMHPSIYRMADSAQRQLSGARRLPGLSDDQRARIEALAAEYDAVYLKLSEQMVLPPLDPFPGDGSQESWQEYARKQAEVQKIGFQRRQLTDKTLLKLRRTLGDAMAAQVPGLAPGDEDLLGSRDGANWFAGEDD